EHPPSSPIQSPGTFSDHADVTFGFITAPLVADLRLNATTSVATVPPFDLDVGQNATTQLATHAEVKSTFSVLSRTMSSQNETNVSTMWRRVVLARDNVTVERGPFGAYKLNQTLTNFTGHPMGSSGSATGAQPFAN